MAVSISFNFPHFLLVFHPFHCKLDDGTVSSVAKHMCHSKECHSRVYESTHSARQAAEVHSIIGQAIEGIKQINGV